MPDYQKMYLTLFNAVTDALNELAQGNAFAAQHILIDVQQKTEEMYIDDD